MMDNTTRSNSSGPADSSPRLARERRTLQAIVMDYCHHHHPNPELCPECQALLDYALARLARCPFQAGKPTCANCPVHCYQALQREKMKTVMRYAGPRLLWRHPLLALGHLLDGFRPAPKESKK